jgi:hypothetical protein
VLHDKTVHIPSFKIDLKSNINEINCVIFQVFTVVTSGGRSVGIVRLRTIPTDHHHFSAKFSAKFANKQMCGQRGGYSTVVNVNF